MEAVFLASGNEFFNKCYLFRPLETDFLSSVLLLRANFVLVETIIQIKVKAISYRATSPLLLETIFYAFFYIFLPVKAVFRCSGNVFF